MTTCNSSPNVSSARGQLSSPKETWLIGAKRRQSMLHTPAPSQWEAAISVQKRRALCRSECVVCAVWPQIALERITARVIAA